ncbi:MAG TPA: hypothetical protein VFN31_00580 [Candidatus Saccharimonadales bacterium]|nr:hypothetical protein [Candidatus Saccharimonadales bacterium]
MALTETEQVSPLAILPEDRLILDESFVLLKFLRDKGNVVDACMPDNAEVFPGKYVHIQSDGRSLGAPPETGRWDIVVNDTVEASLLTTPNLYQGIFYRMSVKDSDGGTRIATQEETHRLATLLNILYQKIDLASEAKQSVEKNKINLIASFGQLIVTKLVKSY